MTPPAAYLSFEEGAERDRKNIETATAIRDVAGFSATEFDVTLHLKADVAPGDSPVLESLFFEWSLEYFTEPQMRVSFSSCLTHLFPILKLSKLI